MKKFITIGLIIIILLIIGLSLPSMYNGMVEREEAVNTQWAQVENVYQRRADLIPNLVNTVKGYAAHEQKTLTDVIDARAKATQTNINASSLNDESIQKFQSAQDGLSQTLSRLMVVVEKYPDLKADKNFLALQQQLEVTEDAIAKQRELFNLAAQNFNTYIKKFPRVIFSSMFGFSPKPYFKADEAAHKAPEVKF